MGGMNHCLSNCHGLIAARDPLLFWTRCCSELVAVRDPLPPGTRCCPGLAAVQKPAENISPKFKVSFSVFLSFEEDFLESEDLLLQEQEGKK